MTINTHEPVEVRAEAFIRAKQRRPRGKPNPSKRAINILVDAAVLGRIDTAARRLGVNRTSWLLFAANKMLDE